MLCPFCNTGETFIKNSRRMKHGKYRKRACKSCHREFDTAELAIEDGLLNDLVASAFEGVKAELKDMMMQPKIWRKNRG